MTHSKSKKRTVADLRREAVVKVARMNPRPHCWLVFVVNGRVRLHRLTREADDHTRKR